VCVDTKRMPNAMRLNRQEVAQADDSLLEEAASRSKSDRAARCSVSTDGPGKTGLDGATCCARQRFYCS
jgi:hypothetical protein